MYFQNMTMMFEVQDLAVASPATVSRCGMVYLEPSILGLQPFVECWLKYLPDAIYSHRQRLQELFDTFLEVTFFQLIDDVLSVLKHITFIHVKYTGYTCQEKYF